MRNTGTGYKSLFLYFLVGVLYGPNGGGKTNLLQALSCLISSVVKPVYDLEKNRLPLILQQKVSCAPFLFDEESSGEPTEFLIYFRTEENEFRYYLAMFQDRVTSESLDRKTIGGRSRHIFLTVKGERFPWEHLWAEETSIPV